MKYVALALLILVVQNAPARTEAPITPGIFWSSYIGMHILEAKTLADLAKAMPMLSQDRQTYVNDLKKQGALQYKTPPFKISGAKISFDQKSFSLDLDYSEMQKGIVKINGLAWQAKDLASYSLALRAINKTFNKTASFSTPLDLIIPKAFASATDYLKTVYAAIVGAHNFDPILLTPSSDWALPEIIIQAYKRDFSRGMGDVTTPIFTCRGKNLERVESVYVLVNGKKYNEAHNIWVFEPGRIRASSPDCTWLADRAGTILSAEGPFCPKKDENLFDHGSYLKLPLVAEQCCRLEGCYEKVKQAIATLQDQGVDRASAPSSAQ